MFLVETNKTSHITFLIFLFLVLGAGGGGLGRGRCWSIKTNKVKAGASH